MARHSPLIPKSVAKFSNWAARLYANESGNVAVLTAFLLPAFVGTLGLGFEVSNWYLTKRAMQNAADAAAVAAATNATSNYDVEAKAVAAQYGYVDGTSNVTVTASNTAKMSVRK